MKYYPDKIKYYEINEGKRVQILQILRGLFAKHDQVKLAYFFGSFIRRAKVRDIDIAIYAIPQLSFDDLLDLGVQIELELKLSVDLIQIQDVSYGFKYRILRLGQPILIKDKNLHNILLAQAFSDSTSFKLLKSTLSSKTYPLKENK
jgi:predicted nucleotidyltransferase